VCSERGLLVSHSKLLGQPQRRGAWLYLPPHGLLRPGSAWLSFLAPGPILPVALPHSTRPSILTSSPPTSTSPSLSARACFWNSLVAFDSCCQRARCRATVEVRPLLLSFFSHSFNRLPRIHWCIPTLLQQPHLSAHLHLLRPPPTSYTCPYVAGPRRPSGLGPSLQSAC
jgi:hypothetical protein